MWTEPVPGRRFYLDQIAYTSGLSWESTYPGGPTTAAVTIDLPGGPEHTALTPGIACGVTVGGADVWTGILNTPTSSDRRSFTATGSSAVLGWYVAFASTSGNAYTLNEAFDRAVTRGLPLTRGNLPTLAAATAPSGSIFLDQALAFVADGLGQFWQVQNDNLTFTTGNNGEQYQLLSADDPGGRTLDNYSNAVYVCYVDTTSGLRGVQVARAALAITEKESILDVTSDQTYSAAQATALGAAAVARVGKGANYTGQFTLTQGQLLSLGGTPVDLATVSAGFLANVINLNPDRLGNPNPTNQVVIGQCTYDNDTDVLTCAPLDAQLRDTTAVLAAAGA